MAEDLEAVRRFLKNEGEEFTRAQHEKFARSFEAYILTGSSRTCRMKAPLERLPRGKIGQEKASIFRNVNKKELQFLETLFVKYRIWQRPIFPGGYPPSIVGARSLYDRVRDGNGWYPSAWSPENLF